MADHFSIIRTILKALGLSPEAVDDIVDRITDFLSEKDSKPSTQKHFPYFVRDDFLSPAEQSFYLVLKASIVDKALICPKVSLGDLFYAKSSDPSEYRTFTNKIDRKHVDFLLCDLQTVRPIAGIELDDKSHQRSDRQIRDEFVEQVFQAAQLPLIRIPARRSYSTEELKSLLLTYLNENESAATVSPVIKEPDHQPPKCPTCGSEMVLRTAKTGSNQGEKFWGCSSFPMCRGIVKYNMSGVSK